MYSGKRGISGQTLAKNISMLSVVKKRELPIKYYESKSLASMYAKYCMRELSRQVCV
jgi:hypothetical protein